MFSLAFPLGSDYGWGICGKQITREMAKLGSVGLLTDTFSAATVGDPLACFLLKRLQIDEQSASLGEHPLLQAIVTPRFKPFRPEVRGCFTVGYTFQEETILSQECLENAKHYYDYLVTGSNWCQEILEDYGFQNISTIVQGVDPSLFEPSRPEKTCLEDYFVIFSGGKLEFRKGQDLVIRAYKVLQDRYPDVLLINSWFNHWQFSLATMEASPYIRFSPTQTDHVAMVNQLLVNNGIDLHRTITLDRQPNSTMPNLYRNTDIGLFPNRCEGGTNLVLMEYMACGKPVIAAYNTGHRDIIHDENSLPLYKQKSIEFKHQQVTIANWYDSDLEEIIAHLDWAYHHRSALQKLGKRAGQDLAQLTWGQTAIQFYQLLESGAEFVQHLAALSD